MNIFVPYRKASLNAQMLDDLRLNKMILEGCQMLCSALLRYNVSGVPYKEAHSKHPCTLWAGNTRGNFQYLCNLTQHMLEERSFRGFGIHKCSGVLDFCIENFTAVIAGPTTEFVNCTLDYKHIRDVHKAYQMQMSKKWDEDIKKPRWTRRGPPGFYLC